jgi:PAS domain S-box-containing protein
MTNFETRYKFLLQLASDGLIIYDKEGKIIDFNEGAYTHLGYTREEFAALRVQDLILETDIKKRPLDFDAITVTAKVTDYRKIKTKDKGTYVIEVSTVMLPDGNYMALAKDITEKARIENDLKMKDHAIASAVSGIGIADLKGHIIYVNEASCKLWGASSSKQLLGRHVSELFESVEINEMMLRVIENGIEYREAKARRLDGSFFDVAYTGSTVRNKHGEPLFLFGSFIDITSRKQAENKLSEKYAQFKFLYELTDAISRANELDDIYELTIRGLLQQVKADRASILQFNDKGLLEFRASFGLSDHYKELAAHHSPWEREVKDPAPILVEDAAIDESLRDFFPVIQKEGITALGFIPLVYSGRLLGKFMVYYNGKHVFTEEEIRLLQTIASEVAFAIGEKMSELALRDSEQLYRNVVDNSKEVIFQLDPAGHWIFLNRAWTEIFGYTREESLGKNFIEFIHPDDRVKTSELFQRIFIQTSKPHSLELRMLTASGQDCWIEFNGRTLHDDKDAISCISGILHDITASKLAREEIIREKDLSDSIINTLPGIFYIYNSNGQFYRWNQNLEIVTGYSGEEIGAMSPLDFFDEPDKEYMSERSKLTFMDGVATAESFLFTKQRDKVPYYFNCIMVNYQGERCAMGMGIDMTERKKVEKQLEESTLQLRELSAHLQDVREEERAMIAREIHDELGQQLTVLRFDMAWIESKVKGEDQILREKLENVQSLLEKAMFTVRKLSSELRPSMLDDLGLADTIEWYLQDYRSRFGIQTYFQNDLLYDQVPDKARTALFRIFQESLTNVIRHAKASKIWVNLSSADDIVVLRIVDNGCGFNMEEVARKKTLGLIGMKERSLLMGGKCQVESKKGQGTVITVTASLAPVASAL